MSDSPSEKEGFSGEGTEFEPILNCVREFCKAEWGEVFSEGDNFISARDLLPGDNLYDAGGGIGFYRVGPEPGSGTPNPENRDFELELRIFPINHELLDEDDRARLIDELNLEKEYYRGTRRPYKALLHIDHIKNLLEQEDPDPTEYFLIHTGEDEPNDIPRALEWMEGSDHCCDDIEIGTYGELYSHIYDCDSCRDAVQSRLEEFRDYASLDKEEREVTLKLVNSMDFLFYDKPLPDRLLAVPLPFLSTPAVLVVLPWPKGGTPKEERILKELAIKLAKRLIEETKAVVYTYVYNQLVDKLYEDERSLKNITKRKYIFHRFIQHVGEILLPSKVEWKYKQEEGYWEPDGVVKTGKQSEVELKFPKFDASVTYTLFHFFRPLQNEVRTFGDEVWFENEKRAIQNLLSQIFRLLVARWESIQRQSAEAELEMFKEVEEPLNDLYRSIEEAKQTANEIENKLSSSNTGFLSLRHDLAFLFEQDETYHYKVDENGRISTNADSDEGTKINTVHSPSSLGTNYSNFTEAWNEYMEVLDAFAESTGDEVIKHFCISDKKKVVKSQFRLLKILVRKPHETNSNLYPIQLLVGLLASTNNNPGITVELDVNGACNAHFKFSSDEKIKMLWENHITEKDDTIHDLLTRRRSGSVSIEGISDSGVVVESILKALMLLAGSELRAEATDNSVILHEASIYTFDERVTVVLGCNGIFSDEDLSKMKAPDLSDNHSLRSCILNLNRSVGQRQLHETESNGQEEFLEWAEEKNKRFAISQNEEFNFTRFFITWPNAS